MREIAGAAGEFLEAERGVRGQQRQPRLDQQFILGQRRRHDALEKILRRDGARAARALRRRSRRRGSAATAHHSEAGSACARLPQKVPRVRIG